MVTLVLNTDLRILTFKYKDINISLGISNLIETIEVSDVDSTGYIEFDTNIGVESLDLFYLAQNLLTDTEMSILKEVFETLTISDFKVEVAMKEIDAAWIKNSAYMILGDFAYILNRSEVSTITIYYLKDTTQKTVLRLADNNLLLSKSNMPEDIMCEVLYIAERNKKYLINELRNE